MKRAILTILLGVFCVLLGAEAGMVNYADEGFSIAVFEAGPREETYQLLHMFLPQRGGFASNVNIQKQAWGGDLADYKSLSDTQFAEYGLEVILSEVRDGACRFEYSGVMQGFELHFYSRALLREGFVFIATATVPTAEWGNVGPLATAVIDSFELE